MTDETLMNEVREGNSGRLALLFDRHHRSIYRYFVQITGQTHQSEDLVQEVFFRILKYSRTFQHGMAFRPWAYQIARNVHIDFCARRKEEAPLPETPDSRTVPFSTDRTPEAQFGRKQEVALLRRALAALPIEKREVLLLSRFHDMKYHEIGQILQIETGAVKLRVYRAIRELGDRFFALQGEKAS